MGGEEGGTAQSHLAEAGSSRARTRGAEAEQGEAEEGGRGSQTADGADLFAAPGAPAAGWPSSAYPAWGAEQEAWSTPWKETPSLTRSWRRCPSEELGQTC